jgi:hypothetical protein
MALFGEFGHRDSYPFGSKSGSAHLIFVETLDLSFVDRYRILGGCYNFP